MELIAILEKKKKTEVPKVEEETVADWSECNFLLVLFIFWQQFIIFYHSRLVDESTFTISLVLVVPVD